MLEALYALSLFLIIISILPIGIRSIGQTEQFHVRHSNMEWLIFVNQLKKELRMSDAVEVYGSVLVLRKSGEVIHYEKYGETIRRRVNQKGHETVLMSVKNVRYEPEGSGTRILVENLYGKQQAALLYSYIEMRLEDAAQ